MQVITIFLLDTDKLHTSNVLPVIFVFNFSSDFEANRDAECTSSLILLPLLLFGANRELFILHSPMRWEISIVETVLRCCEIGNQKFAEIDPLNILCSRSTFWINIWLNIWLNILINMLDQHLDQPHMLIQVCVDPKNVDQDVDPDVDPDVDQDVDPKKHNCSRC